MARQKLQRRAEAILTRPDGSHSHAYVPELVDKLSLGKVDRRTFLRQATLLGVSATAAYAFVGELTGSTPSPAIAADSPKKGGTLRWSMPIQEITDPALFNFEAQSNIVRPVIEYLTHTGADNITRPYLAENWETSDDLKTWTFHLRRDVTWSNGDPFNADDVVFNFKRWLDPATGSSNMNLFSSMLEEVQTGTDENGKPVVEKRMAPNAVEKVDAHTVRLNLVKPDLTIPENLYNYPTAIVHRDFNKMGGNFAKNPIGTGPYELEAYGVGVEAVLRRRDAPYWGEEPYLDRIHYVGHGDDASAALAALSSGQVDGVHDLSIQQLEVIQSQSNLVVQSIDTASTGVARMRVDEAPFDDKRVRQAIAACMDHKRLLDLAYRGHGKPAENHHVAPMHPEYYELPDLKQDHDKARRLLREAGYQNGLTVEIAVSGATGPWEINVVQVFKQQLAPAGIELKINTMPSSRYWEIWTKVPFGFTPWLHRPLGVMVLNLGYRCDASWNETGYCNPEFDKALDEANGILDPEERSRQMQSVERILQDDGVIAQPFWRALFSGTNKRVRGFQKHPSLYHQFHSVWIDDSAQ